MPDDNSDTSASTSEPLSEGKRRRSELRSFPRKLLSEALKVAVAIKENNAGKPWSAPQIADSIGRKQRSSDFQYIISSAREFGLIEGNSRSDAISLTDLGKEVVYPKNSSSEASALFSAFMNVDLFKLVYEYYEGSPLPEQKYFTNTLVDHFKILAEHVDEFIHLFSGNCKFIGINVKSSVKFGAPDVQEELDRQGESPTPNVIVKSGRRLAFVVMPFVERNPTRPSNFFKEVFNSLIKPAVTAAGFDVEWANQLGSDVIQSTVINKILDADMLVADLTDQNPNVLFELGVRVADNRGPIALIKTSDTPRLFDVDNLMRVYEYNQSLWSSTLQIDIPNIEAHVRAA